MQPSAGATAPGADCRLAGASLPATMQPLAGATAPGQTAGWQGGKAPAALHPLPEATAPGDNDAIRTHAGYPINLAG